MISPPRIAARILLPALLLATGCAYFNTFYNAEKNFKEGLRLKDQNQQVQSKAKFDKSIERSARVIQRWPRSRWVDDALFLIGRSYYETGQYGKAMRSFDQLTLAFPRSPLAGEAALFRARALIADKRQAEGLLALQAVRVEYPRLADDATFAIARSFVERDDTGEGTDSLAAFLARYPRSPHRDEALRLLADASFKSGRYDEAENYYVRYARVAPDPRRRAETQIQVAAAMVEQEKWEPALRILRDVIGRYPQLDDRANLLLGRALEGADRKEEAVAAWQKVRAQNDLGAEAMYRIGRHHEQTGDIAAAKACFDTARTRRPESRYGLLAARRGALVEAIDALRTGSKPADEALFMLAEAHNVSLGEYDRALELYAQVDDSFPQSRFAPKARLARAWILRTPRADTAAAEPLLRSLIAEYPETDYADEARRWLGLSVPRRARPASAETTAAPAGTGATTPPEPEFEPTPEPLPPEGVTGRTRPDDRRLRELAGEREPEPEPTPLAEAEPVAKDQLPARPDSAVQDRLELATVYFDTDSSAIRPDAAEILRRNAAQLKDATGVRITLVGHCDPRADDSYNDALGLRRARAVRDFLVAEGVERGRIAVRSEGRRRTVSSGPDEYWLDRRVVFELR